MDCVPFPRLSFLLRIGPRADLVFRCELDFSFFSTSRIMKFIGSLASHLNDDVSISPRGLFIIMFFRKAV
jgi:hypothetical protein